VVGIIDITQLKVTPEEAISKADNSGFWRTYEANTDAGTPTPCSDLNLNKPPKRRPGTIIRYSAVVQKSVIKQVTHQSQTMDTTTVASTTSGGSATAKIFKGFADLKMRLAEIDTERNRYSPQQQKVEDYGSALPQSMHKIVLGIIGIRNDMNGISTQMKEITDLLKQQNNIKQLERSIIASRPCKRRTRQKGSWPVSSNEDTRLTREAVVKLITVGIEANGRLLRWVRMGTHIWKASQLEQKSINERTKHDRWDTGGNYPCTNNLGHLVHCKVASTSQA
jgi:hypothetical protein